APGTASKRANDYVAAEPSDGPAFGRKGRSEGSVARIANHEEENTVQTVTPSLTFKDGAEDALELYVCVITNSKIVNIIRSEGGPIAKGKVRHATFELAGREFTAMDGGPSFSFTEGFPLVATCETQQELDEIWRRLSEDGGEEGRCGWLKDRFGVCWQFFPRPPGGRRGDQRSGNPGRARKELLRRGKMKFAAWNQPTSQQ